MQIEQRSVESVRPYPGNPRVNDGAVSAVARSIAEFGFRQPIVVDADGVIVVGHTRWKAARKLGLVTVPVHVAKDLSPEKARAYRLADNQTGAIAEWDLELLPVELSELRDAGVDLSLLGWDDGELQALLSPPANAGLTDPDEVPAPPDEATTKPGDLWVLGEHRLLCGDAAEPAVVDRLLVDAEGRSLTGKVDLVNSDPPYNVKVEPRSKNAIAAGLSSFTPTGEPGSAKGTHAKLRAKDRPLANDFVPEAEFERLLNAWFAGFARALKPGGAYYLWGGYANTANYPPALKAAGLYFSQTVIWHKQHPVLTRKDFMGDHEWCFYGWKEGAGHAFYGPNNVPDVWSVKKVCPQKMVHLTEKPVELARRAIEYSSRAGEYVLDFFGGSGSTLIAAEMSGRRARLTEIDPLYCDVIVRRWEQFAGKTAERAGR